MSEQARAPGFGRAQGEWESTYEAGNVEALPWFCETLDHDVERALDRLQLRGGRFLDIGTGPGTQAIAMAARGFDATGTDLARTAVAHAAARALARGAKVTFVADDILASRLHATFDLVLDRGCFHVIPPDSRGAYVAAVARLVGPQGYLFVKTFSTTQPGDRGPYRFSPERIRELFGGRFDVLSTDESVFHGPLDPPPRALFSVLRPRAPQ